MGSYKIGQVCVNGHEITSDFQGSPGLRADHCDRCGEKTIFQCQSCKAHIRGYYEDEGFFSLRPWKAPSYCHSCGNAFPWIERKIQAAKDLADEIGGIDNAELDRAKESLIALTSDTPQTPVAVARVKKMLDKAGPAIGGALKDIITGVATEAAKKALGF